MPLVRTTLREAKAVMAVAALTSTAPTFALPDVFPKLAITPVEASAVKPGVLLVAAMAPSAGAAPRLPNALEAEYLETMPAA